MKEKTQIKAVDLVRGIRDEQSRLLAGKSKSEIIAFFRKTGEGPHKKLNEENMSS